MHRCLSLARAGASRQRLASCAKRSFSASHVPKAPYKYTNVLGDDFEQPTTIRAVVPEGFAMQIGLLVPTPIILLNGQIFLWNVPPVAPADLSWRGFTPEAFKVFEVVAPKPEMIVIGTGRSMVPLAPGLRNYLRELGYQLEVQDTGRAAASLNMLAEEGRSVAGALLPLKGTHAITGEPVGPVTA